MPSQQHWSEDPSKLLHRVVDNLEGASAARRNLDRLILRLYYGRPIAAPTMDPTRPSQSLMAVDGAKAQGFSLVRQVIDAAASLVVRVPAVKVLPIGEQFRRQRGAKLLGRFLNGVFYANDVDQLAPRVFVDGATTSFGGLKWYIDSNNEIRCDRVNSLMWLWDDGEGTRPRNMYQVEAVPRRVLAANYPKHSYDIEHLPVWNPPMVPLVDMAQPRDQDKVKVLEAWTLPVGKEPGRHVISAGETVLLDERWDFDFFPMVPFKWSESWNTFRGRPLGEVLIPYQLWTNKLTRVIAEAQAGAVPKVLAHDNAEISPVSDRLYEVIRWRGAIAPQFTTPQALNAEFYNWRDTLKREAFEEAGVNLAAAQGTKPAGLTSAVALREYQDIASTRLIVQTKRFEAFFRDCAKVVVALASKAYKTRKARVMAPGTRMLDEISWDDIDIREDEYSVQVQSVSALPLTVAGRLDFVKELMSEQLITPRDGLRMLSIPDTDSVLDRETAPQDLAERQVEAALWEGKYVPPESIQDLGLLLDVATKELQRALQNGSYPEENLELCRRLIAEAKMLQNAAAPPPPPAPPAPDAGVAPPPVSAPPA